MFNHNPIEYIEIKSRDTPMGRFYQIDESTKFPSITTVLSYGEKEWLEKWKNMLGPKKADKESKRCANRGTAVHKLAEDYLNNDPDYTASHDIHNIKIFNQLKIKLKNIDNIIIQEIPLYSRKLGVAGRTDCIAEYNGVLSIIDFKTSNNVKTLDMVEDYMLQCCFYAIAYNEMYNANITQVVIMIAVEKAIMPQIIIKEIDKELITKLLIRINKFKNKG